jgi:hypothetical protein
MQSSSSKASIVRIIQSDYIAMVAALAPAVLIAMYVAISYFGFFPGLRGRDPIQGSEGAPFFLYGSIVALLVAVPVVMWRVKSIQDVFAKGVEIPGEITNVSFYRDRGRVEYTYSYQGQAYSGGNAVMKTGRTKALTPGEEVTLIVDQHEPRRAVIRDLYT